MLKKNIAEIGKCNNGTMKINRIEVRLCKTTKRKKKGKKKRKEEDKN